MNTYWWQIVGEDSAFCGKEFFTRLKSDKEATHFKYAKKIFPDEKLNCLGPINTTLAEIISLANGLPTY